MPKVCAEKSQQPYIGKKDTISSSTDTIGAKVKEPVPMTNTNKSSHNSKNQALKQRLSNLKAEYTQAKHMLGFRTYTKEQKMKFLKEQHPVRNAFSKGGKYAMIAGGCGVFLASMFCPPVAIVAAVGVFAAGAASYLINDSYFEEEVKKISDSQIRAFYHSKVNRLSREIEILEQITTPMKKMFVEV